ncbi:YdhK family protein [Paenibacillus xylanilyticus]|uniref:YdhK family protein n=1 Tax=Paenibacillus xylanilyticus TaxID=248903 RepID=A0A7Y6EVT0_9BACL|nr:YdhK family protein [Paenibacillus xylanilyticus]NUU75998.1 YdhK family protein [Paenibacillus xylanilyticus]
MKKYAMMMMTLLITGSLMVSGCGKKESADQNNSSNDHAATAGEMHHADSGELPEGIKEKTDPTYPAGSQVIMSADHMSGMKGAKATIVGAYETTAYAVTYTPTTGGDPVKNHKWVIQEEIQDHTDQPYAAGTEVVLNADHMSGMKGAKATIDSAEQTTVYMVDYTPSSGGNLVKNHKWVTESELSAE